MTRPRVTGPHRRALLEPETEDERAGTVPNVVFPTAIEEVDGVALRVLRHGRLQDRRRQARPRTDRHDHPHRLRAAIALLAATLLALARSSGSAAPTGASPADAPPLTNLAHLDFLRRRRSTPPEQAGPHDLPARRGAAIGVLWTYADRRADGSYDRVGGGPYDPATDTWSQGAFNADDVSRAAVVYLRHWQQTGADDEPREGVRPAARAGLPADRRRAERRQRRALDAARRHAEPQPEPVELPDPSDSGRVLLAGPHDLGARRGVRGLPDADPAFAAFLEERLDLAIAAARSARC